MSFILSLFLFRKPKLDLSKLNRWSDEVIKRDKKCLKCGSKKHLEAHHIKPKHKYPKLAYNIENGATLCRDCHRLGKGAYHKIYGYKRANKRNFDKWLNKGVAMFDWLDLWEVIAIVLGLTIVILIWHGSIQISDIFVSWKWAIHKLISIAYTATK